MVQLPIKGNVSGCDKTDVAIYPTPRAVFADHSRRPAAEIACGRPANGIEWRREIEGTSGTSSILLLAAEMSMARGSTH